MLVMTIGAAVAADEEQNSSSFTVLAWTPKRGDYDVDRAAKILRDADVGLIGNVEFDDQGKPPLLVVTALVDRLTSESICQVWFRGKGQRHEPYAITWRESQFQFIDESGVVHPHCGSHPWKLNLGPGATARAQLLHRSTSRIVNFEVANFPSAPAHLNAVVAGVFRAEAPAEWPTIVFADFRTSATNKVFADVKSQSYRAALPKSGHANLWSRKLGVVEASEMHWRQVFPEITAKYAHDHLGDQAPVRVVFSATEEEVTQARADLVRKKKRTPAKVSEEPAEEPAAVEFPAPVSVRQASETDDDLVGEANSIAGDKAVEKPKARRRKKSISVPE